jgi:hypothetical protein
MSSGVISEVQSAVVVGPLDLLRKIADTHSALSSSLKDGKDAFGQLNCDYHDDGDDDLNLHERYDALRVRDRHAVTAVAATAVAAWVALVVISA